MRVEVPNRVITVYIYEGLSKITHPFYRWGWICPMEGWSKRNRAISHEGMIKKYVKRVSFFPNLSSSELKNVSFASFLLKKVMTSLYY